ncbi:hypothetical protein [Natrarchaeobaculum sulfurireducens]|uniref:Uncharacterized protein n=1 Tax=Natrarchaeobaculum sulfurireducens TaxID=2044521 RepID=A0A346PCE1_9EURY|nr:hypothetical protein [Natrarchaeobaculum sulfurireducens]AXR77186.1 hypothetical protein AArc1_0844 [Natrarchaeobaculum sulfurireducens]
MPERDSRNPNRLNDHPRDDHPDHCLTRHAHLEAIDQLAASVLEDVTNDADLEPETARTVVRHVREVRAEVESVRRALPEDADIEVPMVVRRGVGSRSVLGPVTDCSEQSRDEPPG